MMEKKHLKQMITEEKGAQDMKKNQTRQSRGKGKKAGTSGSAYAAKKILRAALKTLLICLIPVFLILAGIGTLKLYPVYQEYKQMADKAVENSTLETFRLQEASFIYDVNGDVIAKLTGDEDSSYLTYEQIPEHAINAFVAIEDRTFWENPGIDVKGIFRVGLNFLMTGGKEMHGASTITQQLARNRFLTREVSLERKGKEMLISLELTKKYSKEQIMEFYVNDISFANTYYGLQAAARGYFNKEAGELSLSQIAYLCAIPNSPTYYNPYKNPENAIKRRDKILGDMKELGYITEEEYEDAVAETITVQRQRVPLHNYETTYAIDCAVRYLMRRDGFEFQYGFRTQEEYEEYHQLYDEVYSQERDALYTGGYNLYTSLDPEKQEILQDALDEVLSFDEKQAENGIYLLQGAATVIDNSTGRVAAIVGGRSQETDTYTLNRAFQSPRQPGSTIKPLIVYAPALENGYHSDTLVKNISVSAAKEKGAVVRELPGDVMPLRTAVELSKNGVAWSVYDDVTPGLGMAYLTQMRFGSIQPGDYYMAASLGGFSTGTTTEEMAGAYASLASGGSYKEPTCIVRMVDNEGEDIFEEYPEIQVYQENTANLMTDILRGVVTRGTAASMRWRGDIPAAGKTGTTNDSKDGWFCGMTPYYTMSVWVGYDQPKKLSSLYGGTYPASIWKNAMEKLVDGKKEASFTRPESDNGMGDGSEYLQGQKAGTVISNGYTVADYRKDHISADAAKLLLDRRAGQEPERQQKLYNEAMSLIHQINGSSMKQRMLNIAETGTVTGGLAVEEESTEEESTEAETEAPSGPASDIGQVKPKNDGNGPGVGPGAELSETVPVRSTEESAGEVQEKSPESPQETEAPSRVPESTAGVVIIEDSADSGVIEE